jgi:hypothetical protein
MMDPWKNTYAPPGGGYGQQNSMSGNNAGQAAVSFGQDFAIIYSGSSHNQFQNAFVPGRPANLFQSGFEFFRG